MENNEENNYIKIFANEEYLKFLEINASQTRLQDQYLIWLSAGILAIGFPQILSLIPIANSKAPYLFLASALFFILTLILCFRSFDLSTNIIDARLDTLHLSRYDYDNDNAKTIEKNNDTEKKYRKKALCNKRAISWSFILGLLLLIIFISINYKIINF